MKFKRDGVLFGNAKYLILTYLVGSIALVFLGLDYVIIPIVLFLMIYAIAFFADPEHITINEDGIVCTRGHKQLWAYKWAEIMRLKVGRYFWNPYVEIQLEDMQNNKEQPEKDAYFRMSIAAHIAIKRYCDCPITKKVD